MAAAEHYTAVRGTTHIPSRAVAGGVAIGAWLNEQRRRFWSAELTRTQVQRLERLPGWTWAGPAERKWHRAYRLLAEYAERHGSADVPLATVVRDVRLGQWVPAQRRGYRAGTLPTTNAAALEALSGWQWERHDDVWLAGIAALHTYVDRPGTAHPPPRLAPAQPPAPPPQPPLPTPPPVEISGVAWPPTPRGGSPPDTRGLRRGDGRHVPTSPPHRPQTAPYAPAPVPPRTLGLTSPESSPPTPSRHAAPAVPWNQVSWYG